MPIGVPWESEERRAKERKVVNKRRVKKRRESGALSAAGRKCYHKKKKEDPDGLVDMNRRKNNTRRALGDGNPYSNPFPKWVPVHYHHVTDDYTVAIPRSIHLAHYTGDRPNHRRILERIVDQVYGDHVHPWETVYLEEIE